MPSQTNVRDANIEKVKGVFNFAVIGGKNRISVNVDSWETFKTITSSELSDFYNFIVEKYISENIEFEETPKVNTAKEAFVIYAYDKFKEEFNASKVNLDIIKVNYNKFFKIREE